MLSDDFVKLTCLQMVGSCTISHFRNRKPQKNHCIMYIILLTTRFYVVIPILVSFVTEVFQVNRMMLLNLLQCVIVVRATVQPGTNISSVHCVHNRGCIRLC